MSFLSQVGAVFLGVFVTFLVYRLWDWRNARRQKAVTKQVISIEIADSMARLEAFQSAANEVLDSGSGIQTLYNEVFPLRTFAYDAAFKGGEVRKLDDWTLEKALHDYVVRCEGFNTEVRLAREALIEKFDSLRDVPPDMLRASVRFRLPNIEDLINRSNTLIKMMMDDSGRPQNPSR